MKMLQISTNTYINPEIIALVVAHQNHINILTKNGKTYDITDARLAVLAIEQLGL